LTESTATVIGAIGQVRGQLPAGMPVVVNTVTGGLVLIGRVPA